MLYQLSYFRITPEFIYRTLSPGTDIAASKMRWKRCVVGADGFEPPKT